MIARLFNLIKGCANKRKIRYSRRDKLHFYGTRDAFKQVIKVHRAEIVIKNSGRIVIDKDRPVFYASDIAIEKFFRELETTFGFVSLHPHYRNRALLALYGKFGHKWSAKAREKLLPIPKPPKKECLK